MNEKPKSRVEIPGQSEAARLEVLLLDRINELERRVDKVNYSLIAMFVYFSSLVPIPPGSSAAALLHLIGA